MERHCRRDLLDIPRGEVSIGAEGCFGCDFIVGSEVLTNGILIRLACVVGIVGSVGGIPLIIREHLLLIGIFTLADLI